MENLNHELWLVYKELGEVKSLSEVDPLRDRIGKVINALNRPAAMLGSIKSEAKAKSSAANGKKGGRPKAKLIKVNGTCDSCESEGECFAASADSSNLTFLCAKCNVSCEKWIEAGVKEI